MGSYQFFLEAYSAIAAERIILICRALPEILDRKNAYINEIQDNANTTFYQPDYEIQRKSLHEKINEWGESKTSNAQLEGDEKYIELLEAAWQEMQCWNAIQEVENEGGTKKEFANALIKLLSMHKELHKFFPSNNNDFLGWLTAVVGPYEIMGKIQKEEEKLKIFFKSKSYSLRLKTHFNKIKDFQNEWYSHAMIDQANNADNILASKNYFPFDLEYSYAKHKTQIDYYSKEIEQSTTKAFMEFFDIIFTGLNEVHAIWDDWLISVKKQDNQFEILEYYNVLEKILTHYKNLENAFSRLPNNEYLDQAIYTQQLVMELKAIQQIVENVSIGQEDSSEHYTVGDLFRITGWLANVACATSATSPLVSQVEQPHISVPRL